MARCWNCNAETEPVAEPRCAGCRVIQPLPPGADAFDVLGIAPSFSLDNAALDAAFRSRSLAVHPDRLARATERERRVAAERTAALNESHRTLRHPHTRAAHLLSRAGIPLDTPADKTLLMELMEAREEAEDSPAARASVLTRIRADHDETLASMERAFRTAQDANALTQRDALLPAAALFLRLRFLHRLVEDLSGVRERDPLHP